MKQFNYLKCFYNIEILKVLSLSGILLLHTEIEGEGIIEN